LYYNILKGKQMSKNKIQRKTTPKKKAMIEALEKTLGVVTTACKIVEIDRGTHYKWLKEDEDYAEAVTDLDDLVLDFAESQLHKKVKDGDTASILFLLKCKGKKRGFVEKQEEQQLAKKSRFEVKIG